MARRPSFSTRWENPRSPLTWVVLLPLFAFLAWFYLPVTRGDFVADDYVFLATARMVDTPLAAFWQSHFYEPYYFRPIGVLSWWVVTDLFGLDYTSHSLINLFLHLGNVALLLWLLRALALSVTAVISGVALFALGPFALATILWPSNRFDLLACGFLLLQAIAMIRALQGNVFAMPLAMVAALAACWSKELAYPVATTMAFVGLAASGVPWQRRVMLFALLGLAIGGAFFVRHVTVAGAYSSAGANPMAQVIVGASTMISSLPRLVELIVGTDRLPWFGWGLLGALFAALIWERRDAADSNRLLGGATLILLAAFTVQTPLAKNFAPMLDGSAFGTVTYARFYYAPWLAVCLIAALIVSRGRLSGLATLTITGITLASAATARPLSESFASWTRNEVKAISVAATKAVEAGVADNQPCVFVFFGTENNQPFFRMFSDVTVKARTTLSDKVWRCHVMTESTPWLFAFPTTITPVDLPLRPIPAADGLAKPDSVWSSIRYRYRLPTKDLAALPGARFFDWRGNRFIEVTDEVRRGVRTVKSRDW